MLPDQLRRSHETLDLALEPGVAHLAHLERQPDARRRRARRALRRRRAPLRNDEEFRRATIDASLIVENFGVVPARTGEGVGREMAMYTEAVKKVGHGAHALAGAHNGG